MRPIPPVRRVLTALVPAVAVLSTAVVASPSHTDAFPLAAPAESPCPQGYRLADYAQLEANAALGIFEDEGPAPTDPSKLAVPVCVLGKSPETVEDLMSPRRAAMVSYTAPHATIPAGLHANAVAASNALSGADPTIPGSAGTWEPYGTGELLGDLPEFNDGRSGYAHAAGRVDSFALDEETGRVFATGSSIGVWMSEDDGRTWTSIGDKLPSPSNGAVTWTPAGGGTVAVITGEMVMGGNVFTGVGAWWTNDLGETWNKAAGVPDNALGFAIEVDRSNPDVIYAATSQGLFRSSDAGRSYENVVLPTGDCAGVEGIGNPCDTANVVTDVIVKVPGGSTDEAGGEVLAVIGHRNERLAYPSGERRSPGQGLYWSATGEPGTFEKLNPAVTDATNVGFVSPERMGRTELGQHIGPDQDHNIVYAVVQDAELMRGGTPSIDFPDEEAGGLPLATNFNGLYVSNDFGRTWLRMADTAEIAYNPASGSTFATTFALNTPGVQSWYNLHVVPDPTRTDPVTGATTRLIFGLEEVWTGRTQQGVPMNGPGQLGPNDFIVVGRYTGLAACIGLTIPLPACPAYPPVFPSTTHPDQHDLIYLPQADGGVTVLAGGDGGVYRADLAPGEDLDNSKWEASSTGMNTLLPYSVAVSEDGTVVLGLQDNGTAIIDPDLDFVYAATLGGDGTGAYIDPYESDYMLGSVQLGRTYHTVNKARDWNANAPSDTIKFVTPLTGDERDGGRVMTTGYKVWDASFPSPAWREVFDLGKGGDGANNQGSAVTTLGDAAYVGFCGPCDVYTQAPGRFASGIATNVGDDAYEAGSSDGWHIAAAEGLPERYVTSIAIDEDDDRTIWVTLGGYAGRKWAGLGTYTDPARDEYVAGSVWKSTDAGETFTNVSGQLPDIRANRVIQRGEQLIVGTDVGAFISSDLDGTSWTRLDGAPFHPVMDLQIRPDHPDELFAALYGRSIWRYTFADAEQVAPVATAPEPVPAPNPLPVTGGGAAALAVGLVGTAFGLRRRGRTGLIG